MTLLNFFMKKYLLFSVLIITILAISGCKRGDHTKEPNSIQLRVLNATPWEFTNCTVAPNGAITDAKYYGNYNFGILSVNAYTPYRLFPELNHRNVLIRVTMNKKDYSLKTYDVLGETILKEGLFTYKLTYNAISDELGVQVME